MRAVVGILLACAFTVPAGAEFDRQLLLALVPSVLKVNAVNNDGSLSEGSGVTISPDTVVTSCHVIKDAVSIELSRGGFRRRVRSQIVDNEHDLCLMKVPNAPFRTVTLSSVQAVKTGQPVIAVGYPGGNHIAFLEGEVKALHDYDGSKVIQSTTPFDSGASGGGLFDRDGNLLGILTFWRKESSDLYFVVPLDWIKGKLTGVEADPVAPFGGGPPFWARPTDSQPFFMQASTLEFEARWGDLLRLTESWSRLEPGNAEPWLVKGKSYLQLKDKDKAIAAFREAIAIDRDYSEAWYHLGLVYLELGNKSELEKIQRALLPLDQYLADDLHARIAALSNQ